MVNQGFIHVGWLFGISEPSTVSCACFFRRDILSFHPPNLIHILIVQETFGGGAEGGVWWSCRWEVQVVLYFVVEHKVLFFPKKKHVVFCSYFFFWWGGDITLKNPKCVGCVNPFWKPTWNSENGGLEDMEDDVLFQRGLFSGPMLVFGGLS